MSFENQAISPKLDIPKRILEGVQMPENIPMPLRTREGFDRLSPEEQQLLLPQISLALGYLGDTLAQIAKQKDRAFADAFNNGPHYG